MSVNIKIVEPLSDPGVPDTLSTWVVGCSSVDEVPQVVRAPSVRPTQRSRRDEYATPTPRGHRDLPPLTPLNSTLAGEICVCPLRYAALLSPGTRWPAALAQQTAMVATREQHARRLRCAHASRERSTPSTRRSCLSQSVAAALCRVRATHREVARTLPLSLAPAPDSARCFCAANEAE